MYDAEMLLHKLSTDVLIDLHNVLSGGFWLGKVRTVLSWRNPLDIRSGVDPFSYRLIFSR